MLDSLTRCEGCPFGYPSFSVSKSILLTSCNSYSIHLIPEVFYFLYHASICIPFFSTFGQLAAVLREVKYLEFRQTEAIPETAMQIYTTRGQLWQYVANLEMTAGRYNKVITRLH